MYFKMKKRVPPLFLLCVTFIVNAQTVTPSVVASDGGSASSAQGSIAWTIGEPVSDTYTKANITTMGFHQPDLDLATMIREQSDEGAVLIYPNPVKDELSINFSGIENGTYVLEVTDALGKLIYQGKTAVIGASSGAIIKMSDIAAAAYFLNITGKDFKKTIKINKIN